MSATRLSAAARPTVLSAAQQHLASRFSFGVDETVIAEMQSVGGWTQWFERQLAWTRLSDPKAAEVAGWFPILADAPAAAWDRIKKQEKSAWDFGYDFSSYTMARKIVARRQVHEVMSDFWSNLLYIPAGEDRSFPWRMSFDQVIRTHALGRYRLMLREAVVHPAMSGWLNNSDNTKNGINENLGRELLELYTVGRSAGYSEADVKDSARILTGFKVKIFNGYAATYETKDHFTGRVTVMGFSDANTAADGREVVGAYLDYLARHPATAQRIARRLCVRFVSDSPSDAIVAAVAKAYLTSDTDIRAALRALVRHPDFVASVGQKVRTPIEDVVITSRVLGAAPTAVTSDSSLARHLVWLSTTVGQQQFEWPRPDGFPETSSTWTSASRLIRSWTMHYSLVANWWGSKDRTTTSAADQLPTTWPQTLGDLTDHQSRVLLGRPATSSLRAAVADIVTMPQTKSFANAAAVPDWAWMLLRGAVLNTPEGMLR